MGRAPCCDKTSVKRGPWSPEEDATLKSYLEEHGTGGNWISLPLRAGLKRCGKSCRLRWLNYLRPDIKHGGFTEEEDHIIISLYSKIGSRWSVIATNLPGRTDNDVKNHWNTKLKKKLFGKDNNKPSTKTALPLDNTVPSNHQFYEKLYNNNNNKPSASFYEKLYFSNFSALLAQETSPLTFSNQTYSSPTQGPMLFPAQFCSVQGQLQLVSESSVHGPSSSSQDASSTVSGSSGNMSIDDSALLEDFALGLFEFDGSDGYGYGGDNENETKAKGNGQMC